MHRIAFVVYFVIALVTARAMTTADDSNNTIQPLLAAAGRAQARGDFGAAAADYRKAVALAPAVPELWANLGLMDYEAGHSSEALDSFQQAIRLKPSLFVPQLFCGIVYLDTGHADKAITFLQNAVKLNPGDLQAQRSLGKAYAMTGRDSRAVDSYLNAIELKPDDDRLWVDLGTAWLQQVEDDARTMSADYAHSPYFDLRAAEIFAEEGKLVQASDAWKAALASPAPPPCTHAQFGITLLREHKVAEARLQFQQETEASSRCGLTALGIALADLADGRTEVALRELEPIVAADRGFVRSSLPLFYGALSADRVQSLTDVVRNESGAGDLAIQTASLVEKALGSGDNAQVTEIGDQREASPVREAATADAAKFYAAGRYAVCDRTLKLSPETLTAVRNRLLTTCSFYTGDFQTASFAAQRLKAIPETAAEGIYWESKADEKLAVAALTRAGQIDPNSARMHVLIGDAFRQKRRWGDAEAEYRKAVAVEPKSESARLSLALVLFSEMQTEEALALDHSLLAEQPGDPEANLLAGEILVQQNKFKEAEPYLTRCANLRPELVPHFHVLLGRIYAETGRIDEAIAEYKLGLSADEDGSLHFQIARLYQKTGNRAAAEEAFRESKRLTDHFNDLARIGLEESSTDLSRQ